MNRTTFPIDFLLMLCAVWAPAFLLAEHALPAAHGPHAEHSPTNAVKAPEPREEFFIALDPSSPKRVNLVLVAAYNEVNYGMNFNGFANGRAKYVIPQGWTVSVIFTNKSPVPHSVVVVERAMVRRIQPGDPSFKGGSTPNPLRGTTGNKGERFQFVAEEAGEFAFACGFPAHAASGHWIALEVSATATLPSLRFGEKPPHAPKQDPAAPRNVERKSAISGAGARIVTQ